MAWFNTDDKLHSHPKTRAAGLEAIGLWTVAGSWSAQERTRGRIPAATVRALGGTEALAGELVEAGLWEEDGDGYRFTAGGPCRFVHTRLAIPRALRAAVYERDGHRCVRCGSSEDLTLDHIHPWSKGGADTEANLQTMCRPCNCSKGARIA